MAYAFFDGKFVPLAEAKVSIMTHAFNYGTGCFEGIRAYWNAQEEQLYVFHLRAHFERLERSAKILHMGSPYSAEEMCELTLELLRRNEARTDTYVRPSSTRAPRSSACACTASTMASACSPPPSASTSTPRRARAAASTSWRRIDDNSIPARAKVIGGYINSALAKTEAVENGFDEAIMLTQDGHVSEGSGENIFLVEGSSWSPRPAPTTSWSASRAAASSSWRPEEFGLQTVERSIDRSELYAADECFMTGTAAEVTPVVEVDRRPVGQGGVGPLTAKLQKTFMDIALGVDKRYAEWRTPVLQVGVQGGRGRPGGARAAASGAAHAPAERYQCLAEHLTPGRRAVFCCSSFSCARAGAGRLCGRGERRLARSGHAASPCAAATPTPTAVPWPTPTRAVPKEIRLAGGSARQHLRCLRQGAGRGVDGARAGPQGHRAQHRRPGRQSAPARRGRGRGRLQPRRPRHPGGQQGAALQPGPPHPRRHPGLALPGGGADPGRAPTPRIETSRGLVGSG